MDKDIKSPNEENDLVDILQVEGVNAKGFGTIPKMVMKDKRLSLSAKGLYAYFCSYSGSGNRVFPGRDTIVSDLQINKETYYRHLESLKKYDYIRVTQIRTNGKFKRNIYTLVANPKTFLNQASSPCTEIPDTVGEPCTEKPYTENPDNNINSLGIIDNLSINHNSEDNDRMDRIEDYSQIVKENIEYDLLLGEWQNQAKLIKSIFTLIIDILCSTEKTFQINRCEIDAQVVKQRFLQLGKSDIDSVLLSISQLTTRIRNPRNYLITVLYNSPATSETKWAADIGYMVRSYNERKS